MKNLTRTRQILAAVLLATTAGILTYPAWIFSEALLDFLEPPRRIANVGLLLLFFVPLVLLGSVILRKFTSAARDFFATLPIAAMLVMLGMLILHQSAITTRWDQTPQGKQEEELRHGAAAHDQLTQPGALAKLQPPLDQYQVAALASLIIDPRLDPALLHHILITFPKQVDCAIVKNSSASPDDLTTIWNERTCPDYDFAVNRHTPFPIVQSIFESPRRDAPDWQIRSAREMTAARLAKESCDPQFLYSLFNAKDDLAPDTKAGLLMRIDMTQNPCTPKLVRAQMQSPPELQQAAQQRGQLPAHDRQTWEAQNWHPAR